MDSKMNQKPPQPQKTAVSSAPPDAQDDAGWVAVTGYPPFTHARELERVMGWFGPVRLDDMHRRRALLRYTRPGDAAAAIQAAGNVMIYGHLLKITKPTPAKQRQRREKKEKENKQAAPKKKEEEDMTDEKSDIVQPKDIDLSGDFHQQLAAVLDAVRLTQQEVTAISALYVDVETVLQEIWQGCVANPFGSITTGLGIKTSDADCFVYVPPESRRGEVSFVNKAKKQLYKYPDTFKKIISIPSANTPIVKFFHVPTETNCDLSFKTPLGTRNSKLIAFLLHVDPRLIPMAVFIKYWGKVGGFTGSGKLTNYALTMLVIFYLQQVDILPSVCWLQRDPADAHPVDNWNTGFSSSYDPLPPPPDTPLPELIGGFFEFYTEFNFDEDVVCPYLGRSVKKSLFSDFENLPVEFDLYKRNVREGITAGLRVKSHICVQDPFELCHNVGSVIGARCSEEIKWFFAFSTKHYYEGKHDGYINFLKTILLEKPQMPLKRKSATYRVAVKEGILGKVQDSDWRSVIRTVVFQIFETILKMKLTKVDDKSKIEHYTSKLDKPIWKRKQFTRLYKQMKLDFLETHTRITEEILRVNKDVLDIKYMVTLSLSRYTKTAIIAIKFVEGDVNIFKEFGQFFLSVAKFWIRMLLRPYFHNSENVEFANDEQNNDAAQLNSDVQVDVDEHEESTDSDSDEEPTRTNSVESGREQS